MKNNISKLLQEKLPKVVILTGDDYISREKFKERFLQRLKEDFNDVTVEGFNSSIEPFEVYIEKAMTYFLFASVRFFHIQHAQTFSVKELARLASVLSVNLQDVYFFIEFEKVKDDKIRSKEKPVDVAGKLGIQKKEKKDPERYAFVKFEKPPDYQLAKWMTQQVPVFFNRRITQSAAERLIDLAGGELDILYSELQKIDIHLDEGVAIEKAEVENIINASRSATSFELAEALSAKNSSKALYIIDSLYRDNVKETVSIAVIAKHFWKIFKLRAYSKKNRDIANAYFKTEYREKMEIAYKIAVGAGVFSQKDKVGKAYPVIIKPGLIDQAAEFKDDHLKRIFEYLRDYDTGIKTGRIKPTKYSFQLLCYKIVNIDEIEEEEFVL